MLGIPISMAAAMLLLIISSIRAQDFPNPNEVPQQQPQQPPPGLQFPGPSPFSLQAQSAEQMIESSLQPGGLASGLGDSVMDPLTPSIHEGVLQLQNHRLTHERQVQIFRQQQQQQQQAQQPQLPFSVPSGPQLQPGPHDELLMSDYGPPSSGGSSEFIQQNPTQINQGPSSGSYPGPSELRREEMETWQDFHANPVQPQLQAHEAHPLTIENVPSIQYPAGQPPNYAFLPPPPNFKLPTTSNAVESEDELNKPVTPASTSSRRSKKISNGRKKKVKAGLKPVNSGDKTSPRGDVRVAQEQEEPNYDYVESGSDIEIYRVPVGHPQEAAVRQTKQRRNKKPKKSTAGTNTNVLYYEDPRDISNINVLKDLHEEHSPRRRKPTKQTSRRQRPAARRPIPIQDYVYDYVEVEDEDQTLEVQQQEQQPSQKYRTKQVSHQRTKSQAEMDNEFLIGKLLPELLAFQRNSGYAAAFYQNMLQGMAPPPALGHLGGMPMFPMMIPTQAPPTTTPATSTTTSVSPPNAPETVSETPLTSSGNAAIVGSISYDFTVPQQAEEPAPPHSPPEAPSSYYKSALFLPSQVADLFDQRPVAPPTQLPASPAPPTTLPLPPFVPTQVSYIISPQHQRHHVEIQPSNGYHYRERDHQSSYSVDPVVSPVTPPPPKKMAPQHHGTMSPLRHLAQLSKYFYPKHLMQYRPLASVYGTAAPPPSQAPPPPPVKVIQSMRGQQVYLQPSLQHPEGFKVNMKNPPRVLYSAPPGNIRVSPQQQFVHQSPPTPPKLPGLPAHLVPLTSGQAQGMLNNPLLLPQDPMHRLQLQEALQLVSRFTAVQSARLNGFPPSNAGSLVPISETQALRYLPAVRQRQPTSHQQYIGQMAYGSEVKPVVVPPPGAEQSKSDSDSAVGDSNQVNVIAVPNTSSATTESNATTASMPAATTQLTTVGTTTTESAAGGAASTTASPS